jgi:two-component system cell cycle sensor histidine kinase/response regulator CckA
MEMIRALVIEDSEDDCAILVRTLKQGGYDVDYKRVDSAETLLSSLDGTPWDIVLSDYSMPGFSGTAALHLVREKGLDVPFLFVSGTIGEEIAVNAMRVGAQDYIMKSNLKRLLPAINRELREFKLRKDHKNLERRMRQLEKFEAIGRLAGGVAHDFNNVIGAIMGWADLGKSEVPEGSRASKFFHQIANHSQRAAGLTRQLLAYARRQILEPRSLDLNEAIRESAGLLERLMTAQIQVEMDLASDLNLVRADRSQFEQVLMNLCVNARDAMANGGQLTIQTANTDLDEEYCQSHMFGPPGSYVRMTISDTGMGMDAATIERIFEPFFTTKEVGKGTGLGLATAMGVVTQHGGSIEVESKIGVGTSFFIYLPAASGEEQTQSEIAEAVVPRGTETILIADDHDGLLETTEEILRNLGYRVIVARNGEEAVQEFAIHAKEIALLVLDVVMPALSGPEAYSKISEMKPNVPVIFTSGYTEETASVTPTIGSGAVFLQKPCRPDLLGRTIRELLDRKTYIN